MIVNLYTGQTLTFPDGTDEDVIRKAIQRVMSGAADKQLASSTSTTKTSSGDSAPDFSDVTDGSDGPSPASAPAPTYRLRTLPQYQDQDSLHLKIAPSAPAEPNFSDIIPGGATSTARIDQNLPSHAEILDSLIHGSPLDAVIAKRAQLADIAASGDVINGPLDPEFRPHTAIDDLHAAYAAEGRDFANPEERTVTSEFIKGIPSRVAGSIAGLTYPVQVADAAAHGVVGEIRGLANPSSVTSTGDGFRRSFESTLQDNPLGRGSAALQRAVVDPARERLLDASIVAGDSPSAAASLDTAQEAVGQALNPGNYIGLEALRGTGAIDSTLARTAALEAQGGARSLEDVGIVAREYGRGSAPSEIAQAKLARDLAVPKDPFAYYDEPYGGLRGGIGDPPHGSAGWKGVIPDTLRDITGRPWREYETGIDPTGEPNPGIPLEKPTSPSPRPRNVERDPLPLPPIDPGVTGGDDETIGRVAGLWDYASRRYPSLAAQVERIKINEPAFGGYYEPETGTIAVPWNADLGTMMHEFGHIAQHVRGQIGDGVDSALPEVEELARIEQHPTRLGDVYSRIPPPIARNVGRENLIPRLYPWGPNDSDLLVPGMDRGGWGVTLVKDSKGVPIQDAAGDFTYQLHVPDRPVRVFQGTIADTTAEERVSNALREEYLTRNPKLQQLDHQGHTYFGQPGDLPPGNILRRTFPHTSNEIADSADLKQMGDFLNNHAYGDGTAQLPESFGGDTNPRRLLSGGGGTAEASGRALTADEAIQRGLRPLTHREYLAAATDPSVQPTGSMPESDAKAFTSFLEKNNINPDHAERFGEVPELQNHFFDLHNPEPEPLPGDPANQPFRAYASRPPYANAPDSLMGFTRDGSGRPSTGFEESRYPMEQPVRVTFPDGSTHEDSIAGLNQAHAMERARRNWPDAANIEPTGNPVRREIPPFRAYARPPAPLPPPLPEEDVAVGMGWKPPSLGSTSPASVGPPIVLPEFQTNLAAQLGGDQQIANYIIQRSDEVFKKIGPPQSWDTLEEMASRLGTTKEQFLSQPSHWSVLSPQARLRLLHVINGNEVDIAGIQSKLIAGTATDVEKADLLRMIESRGDMLKLGASSASDYARALNSAKMDARLYLSPDNLLRQQLYTKYSKQIDAAKPLLDSLARLDPSNLEELQSFLRSVNKPKFREYLHEYWVNSILASPIPFARKVIGDTIAMMTENTMVRPLAAMWDAARVAGTGAERAVFLRETPEAIIGLTHGIRKGFARGLEVLQRGYDPEVTGNLFLPRSAFARSQNQVVRDIVGPVVTAPVRLISAATTMARTMNFTAEIYAQAARLASKEGLSGAGLSGRIAELVANPIDEILQAADKFARKATFTDETSALGTAVVGLRDLPGVTSPNPVINAGLETYRATMGFMLPFVHIADRLMARGLEYTPLSALESAGERKIGNFAESANLAAKASIGSLVMAYAASLAMEGRITAGAPSGEAERAAFYGANKQPWSIRTDGGAWIPYGHMQPIAMPFALVASMHKGWTENQDAPAMEKLGNAAAQIGGHITDQSYLQSLHKMTDVISGSEQNAGKAFSDIAASTAFGFVPYSGLVRTVSKSVDPRVIDAKTISEKMQQNIPVASLGINGKLDPWGEEVIPTGGRLRTVLASGTAMLPSQEHRNPLDDELERIGMPLGYVGKTISSKKDGGTIKLNQDEQYMYQQTAGRASKLALQNLFAKEGYPELDVEAQREAATSAIGQARKFARILTIRYHRGLGYPGLNPTMGYMNSVLDSGAK